MFWTRHPKENIARHFSGQEKRPSLQKTETRISTNIEEPCVYIGQQDEPRANLEREGEIRPRSTLLGYLSRFYYYSLPVAGLFKLFLNSIVNSIISLSLSGYLFSPCHRESVARFLFIMLTALIEKFRFENFRIIRERESFVAIAVFFETIIFFSSIENWKKFCEMFLK